MEKKLSLLEALDTYMVMLSNTIPRFMNMLPCLILEWERVYGINM
jgi:hypothetical protein